jgi:hypothetical protein
MRLTIGLLSAAVGTLAALAAVGCNNRPPQADAGLAREILDVALTAWKSGETPTDLQDHDPSIVVADRDWAAGKKLVDYQVNDKNEFFGADLRCTVYLTLEAGAQGKPRKKKATYSVGTHRTFTVVREDDD